MPSSWPYIENLLPYIAKQTSQQTSPLRRKALQSLHCQPILLVRITKSRAPVLVCVWPRKLSRDSHSSVATRSERRRGQLRRSPGPPLLQLLPPSNAAHPHQLGSRRSCDRYGVSVHVLDFNTKPRILSRGCLSHSLKTARHTAENIRTWRAERQRTKLFFRSSEVGSRHVDV